MRYLEAQATQLVLLILFGAALMLRGLTDTSFGFPDAGRILMDGVFIRDVLVDLPFRDPWEYAQSYFAQYPALSIGYRPPFFPFVEAIFNLIFGVNIWSSRLALFSFVIVGIISWYKLVRNLSGQNVAFASSLLWLSTPFLAQWGWYTMAELPVVSMSLLAIYYLVQWLQHQDAKYCFALALSIGIAAWTKQTAAFLVVTVVLALLVRGQFKWAVSRPAHWGSALVLLAVIAPLIAMTLAFGDQNIHQSIGDGTGEALSRVSVENWLLLPRTLMNEHLSMGVLTLSFFGLLVAQKQKLTFRWLPVVAILSVYLFFSLLIGKNARYAIFWIPFWCLLAALPLQVWSLKRMSGRLYGSVILILVGYQTMAVFDREPVTASGYDIAAQRAVAETQGPSIFVDAYNNGYFTFFARQADKNRQLHVLRGDKLLSSSSIVGDHWLEVHAATEQDILRMFDELGVSVIVAVSVNYMGLDIHEKLRTLLEDKELFVHLDTIPVSGNRIMSSAPGQPAFEDVSLNIYRYLDAKPEISGDIRLRLPVVGKTLVQKAADPND